MRADSAQPVRPRTIGDLPFLERPALELLRLDRAGDTVDVDYTGFGWARIDRLWLADPSGARRVDDALVLALHAADEGEVLSSDVELEFVLPDGPSVTALLSAFLARWLPRLPAAPAIVLAMCNPHQARLVAPEAAGPTPVHYGHGDVDAWLDVAADDGKDRLRLLAAAWERA